MTFRLTPTKDVLEQLSIIPDDQLDVVNNTVLALKQQGEPTVICEFSQKESELVLSL